MYNKTVADWLFETKDDIVGICTDKWQEILITIVFILTISRGRSFWVKFLGLELLCEAVVYLFYPQIFGLGQLDDLHMLLFRGTGVVILAWCIGCWLLSKSTDSTVETSLLWAYTMIMGCILMAQGYYLSHPPKKQIWNVSILITYFYGTLLVTVGTAYHALNSREWGGYGEVASHANLHLRIEFVLLMVMALMQYALPQWIIRVMINVEKINSSHALLARVGGSFGIGMAIMSGRAANFLRKSDKESVLLSHWLGISASPGLQGLYIAIPCYVVTALAGWYMLFTRWTTLTWAFVGLYAIHDLVIIMNATGALDIDPSVFSRILVPRVKALPEDVMSVFRPKMF